jgi:cytochrome c oxidase cbb3-type subunit 3
MKAFRTLLMMLVLPWVAIGVLGAQTEAEVALAPAFSTEFLIEYTFVGVAIILLFIIFMLSRFYSKLLSTRGQYLIQKVREKSGAAIILAALLIPSLASAENSGIMAHMTNTTYFVITLVIVIELFVIAFLVRNITAILGLDAPDIAEGADQPVSALDALWASFGTMWSKVNAFKSQEKEKELLKEHEYDGIRELDNDLPPWWVWGFYLTIFFSVVYLWRYHVSETAPLQEQELEIAIAKAEEEMAAYRATAANLVDETSVTIVEDEGFLERGKQVYMINCVACHGNYGEGGVGPNLTDDYWLHGNSISDVFKVVKYGVVEKGMTPWKDLLSPTQIAQVSNYVKTLHGTNPPNPKEPQGKIYTAEPSNEEGAEDNTDEGAEM